MLFRKKGLRSARKKPGNTLTRAIFFKKTQIAVSKLEDERKRNQDEIEAMLQKGFSPNLLKRSMQNSDLIEKQMEGTKNDLRRCVILMQVLSREKQVPLVKQEYANVRRRFHEYRRELKELKEESREEQENFFRLIAKGARTK